jgi:hypothetical protein
VTEDLRETESDRIDDSTVETSYKNKGLYDINHREIQVFAYLNGSEGSPCSWGMRVINGSHEACMTKGVHYTLPHCIELMSVNLREFIPD